MRDDLGYDGTKFLRESEPLFVEDAFSGMPLLRSKLSTDDSDKKWHEAMHGHANTLYKDALFKGMGTLAEELKTGMIRMNGNLATGERTISRIAHSTRGIDPGSKEGQLALLLVRLFRSLDPLVGGDAQKRHEWLRRF